MTRKDEHANHEPSKNSAPETIETVSEFAANTEKDSGCGFNVVTEQLPKNGDAVSCGFDAVSCESDPVPSEFNAVSSELDANPKRFRPNPKRSAPIP